MTLRVLRPDGTEVMPGDEIISRTGETWCLIAATHATTPATFGKVSVRRPLPHPWSSPFESGHVFTDFAFGLTVRGRTGI